MFSDISAVVIVPYSCLPPLFFLILVARHRSPFRVSVVRHRRRPSAASLLLARLFSPLSTTPSGGLGWSGIAIWVLLSSSASAINLFSEAGQSFVIYS